jgi:UDP-N-acetylglucosamine 4,6-dehydratase (inverting)
MFKKKNILITGGTGSFGKAFIRKLLTKYINFNKIIIYSRDEFKQYEMQKEFFSISRNKLRFFLGDVRDKDRLSTAVSGVDYVIHAAALKHVPAAEYNPMEYIKTNIIGAQNLIECCLKHNISKVIALSTDKASSPINLYGATKLCSDKLFVSANNIVGKNKTRFSVVRYGNVFGSRGSVVPLFLQQNNQNFFTVTDKSMTRFNITMAEAVETVLWTIKNGNGSEIVVPKIPSYRILDLCKSINSKKKITITGLRSGEKIHEQMISSADASQTVELDKYFIILPNFVKVKKSNFYYEDISKGKVYLSYKKIKKVSQDFSYSSDKNKFLEVSQIKKLTTNLKIDD